MSDLRLRIQTYRSFEEAEFLRPAWDLLARDNFMLSWAWLSTWWRELGSQAHESRSLILVSLTDEGGELFGIAPLYRSRQLSGRSLRFLGDGEACSDYIRVLSRDDYESPVYVELARWIADREFTRRFGMVDWMEVEGYVHGNRGWIAFWNELARNGWSRHDRECEGSWVAELDGDQQDFYQGIPKHTKRKYKKALQRLESGAVGHTVITDPAELEREWPEFVRLHQLRRTSLNQPGCFADPHFALFLHDATMHLALDGRVHLSKVTCNGESIAYLLLFESTGRLAMYQSGLHPEYEPMEPGHLVNTMTLRYAIDQGFTKYDFLRGDEPYKSRWKTTRIPLVKTRCVSPRMVSQLKNNLWMAGRTLKAWSVAAPPPASGHPQPE
jgi:CelD/BcsL family acetyltransferase involved in cellulose biosynthesis